MITFEDIKHDGKLWAVHFAGEELNELDKVFTQWNDAGWLLNFFRENFGDLVSHFKITKLDEAVYDTMEDSDELECLILDIKRLRNDIGKRKGTIERSPEPCQLATYLCHKTQPWNICHYRWRHKTDPYDAGA